MTADLAGAVRAWRLAPADPGRHAFLERVAQNALAIAAREATLRPAADAAALTRLSALLGRDGPRAELEAALAVAIREGALSANSPEVFAHLRASTLDALAVDQPRYRHALAAGPAKPNR